ncbi:MAG TPA: right-handed parallel beta-helix repeat-containing protein [Puia sp.]|nr:right-handed parallel beta-helix repeat-containing protein [Puia sp.]
MKRTFIQTFSKCVTFMVAGALTSLAFSTCTKNSTTAFTGPIIPAEAIRGTILNGGNVKGVMLGDSTYTMNGDLTVLPADTLTIQAGATINVTGNHAFYIQGIIQSLGTQAKPITFTSTGMQQPGQWGGFQADSAKSVTFYWTKILWTGGPDSTGGTRQTIGVKSPIPVDIEDCWLIGGQDNAIGVYAAATVKILRNTFYGNGTTDGDAIDFHSGVTGTVAYNVLWGGAGSAIKIFTSATIANPQTNAVVYNNTCVDNGFRRGAAEPGRGILVDAFSQAKVYNNLLVNNYWSLDVTPTADFANTQYGNNFFHVTVDSLRQFMYPAGEKGVIQSSDIIDSVHLGANDPMFVNYTAPPDPSLRIIPTGFDFHLKPGSPALGKGDATYNSDIGAYVSDTSNGKGNRH